MRFILFHVSLCMAVSANVWKLNKHTFDSILRMKPPEVASKGSHSKLPSVTRERVPATKSSSIVRGMKRNRNRHSRLNILITAKYLPYQKMNRSCFHNILLGRTEFVCYWLKNAMFLESPICYIILSNYYQIAFFCTLEIGKQSLIKTRTPNINFSSFAYFSNFYSTLFHCILFIISHFIMASTALDVPAIKWSSQLLFLPVAGADLNVNHHPSTPEATLTTTPGVSGQKLSDKISLPSSVLESFLAQSSTLPSPLTFKITNPASKKSTHVGIKEFSADEGTARVPFVVASRIGLEENQPVHIQYQQLPKATALTLTVLEEDHGVDDWKALLEAQLQSGYTALTKGDTLVVTDPASNNQDFFQCLVTDVKPADAVCIVDTDIDLDIVSTEPKESVKGKGVSTKSESKPVDLAVAKPSVISHLSPADDASLILKEWNPELPLIIQLTNFEKEESANVNLFVGNSEYATSPNSFIWSTLLFNDKTITINPTDPYLSLNDKPISEIYISLHAEKIEFSNLIVTIFQQADDDEMTDAEQSTASDSTECTNCHQTVPTRSYQLHITFCERNNIACPDGCGQLFLRREGGIPKSHWHCKDHNVWGNTSESKSIHDRYIHTPIATCAACNNGEAFPNHIAYAHHRATTCPMKLHICRFCHLKLPQEHASPVDILEGYSGHESHCGSRTTDCPRCKKAVRLRELASHMEYHNLQRITNPNVPRVCTNLNCVRTLAPSTDAKQTLGLCGICFGPLHNTAYDPTGAKLRQRIERRYVIQLTRGCGRAWCMNTSACATANPVKQAMPAVMSRANELVAESTSENSALGTGVHMWCVDEMTTKRKLFVDYVVQEGVYSREWACKAIEMSKGNEGSAQDWLEANAVKISER